MLIESPFGESREIVEDDGAIGVEDVRPVCMHEHTVVVVVIERVSADVRSSVDDQYS